MVAYEKVALEQRPDVVVVVGDVNSTLACALVATKLCIPVVHLEAGLRSGDRRMPEEINRLATDAIADVLWTPSPDADEHLAREGVPPRRIDRVGNIMIDSFVMLQQAIAADDTRARMGLGAGGYAVLTLHRPSNVDTRAALAPLVEQLRAVARLLPVVFPVHPRTRARLQEFGLLPVLEGERAIRLVEPLGYVQFMNLVTGARAVITDSGGVQEETTYLDIPCLTLRENTERPITISEGSNRLVKPAELPAAVDSVLGGGWPSGRRPALWDGQTATRCAAALRHRLVLG